VVHHCRVSWIHWYLLLACWKLTVSSGMPEVYITGIQAAIYSLETPHIFSLRLVSPAPKPKLFLQLLEGAKRGQTMA